MAYETFKALHLIFVVTWFAGLFYIVRLFIYHAEALENRKLSEGERNVLIDHFKLMQKRLWYGITWPSALLALFFGLALMSYFMPLTNHPWLKIKLIMVALLFGYHFSCGHIYKKLNRGQLQYNPTQLRIWNEVATVFLVGIVFLAVFKHALALGWAVLGLLIFSGVLMLAIWIYKKIRLAGN